MNNASNSGTINFNISNSTQNASSDNDLVDVLVNSECSMNVANPTKNLTIDQLIFRLLLGAKMVFFKPNLKYILLTIANTIVTPSCFSQAKNNFN